MKYNGKTMVNRSRFTSYTDSLSEEDKSFLYREVDRFVEENKEYCDKGNHQHLCNIFTSMALYDLLLNKGVKKEIAFETVANTMYTYMYTQKKKFERMSKYPFFWSMMKRIVPLGFRLGSGNGWKFTWYKNQDSNTYRFECNKCIYQSIFEKYDKKEFGPMFCKNDVLVYGNLNCIDFKRTGTLCQGYDRCDFCFVRYPKNQSFERSKSQ